MRNNYLKNRKKKSSLKIYIFAGIFFCLLAGLTYVVIWLPYFWIENINIEDNMTYVSPLEIKEFVPKKSIFLISIDQIKNEILNKYPEIKIVEIEKRLPNILNIKIQERKNVGVWCQIEKEIERKINECFYFDSDGIIFREASLIKGSLVLNVYGTKKPIKIRDNIMSSELFEFILTVKQKLPEIKITSVSLPEVIDFEIVSFEDLIVTTSQGWQIYFNPTYSVRSQLEALRIVIEKEIKQNLSSLEYIDLKIKGRVYYK